jgi:hypothetical protein
MLLTVHHLVDERGKRHTVLRGENVEDEHYTGCPITHGIIKTRPRNDNILRKLRS